jgi:hypothetical protein
MMSYSQDKTKFAQGLPESIWLEPEDFEEAAQISNPVTGEAQQWQSYVNGLALIGFERWVNQRDANLSVNRENCSLFQRDNGIDAVCNLTVGEFRVCLIVTEELTDNVSIPNNAVNLPELAGHFYVVMEVLEEQEQVVLSGLLRYDKLIDYRDSVKLQVGGDEYHQIPLSLFEPEMNHLLFYSRYLEPSAIPLPIISAQKSPIDNSDTASLIPLSEQVINLALWLRDEIDDLTRNLGWGLPAPLIPATATGFRSIESFDTAIAQLMDRGINIPAQASGSCRTIYLGEISLEVLAGIWALPPTSDESIPKWSLLLILSMPSGGFLPKGIRLQVKDVNSVLYDKILENDDYYLMVRLIANVTEQLTATIELQGEAFELEPFAFNPDAIPGTIQNNLPGFRSISVAKSSWMRT